MNIHFHFPVYSILLVICSCVAIASEVVAILFINRIIVHMDQAQNDTLKPGPFLIMLGVLSAVYILDVVLLLFSGDPVFRLYGWVLILLSGLVWTFRQFFKRLKAVMIAESTICLVLLIDVVRTAAARW